MPNRPIKELTDSELVAELDMWEFRIQNAKSWGAALGAAAEFRDECRREIALRNSRRKTFGFNNA